MNESSLYAGILTVAFKLGIGPRTTQMRYSGQLYGDANGLDLTFARSVAEFNSPYLHYEKRRTRTFDSLEYEGQMVALLAWSVSSTSSSK